MRYWGPIRVTFGTLAALTCLPACATIVTGTTQDLQFTSEPPGAQVFIDGASAGKTPLLAKVKRASSVEVLLKKEGCKDQSASLGHVVNQNVWLNLFSGFLLTLVDYYSGAMYEYDPNFFHAKFVPSEAASAVAPGGQ